MSSRFNAKLVFNSNLGERVRLNIPRANSALTEPQVRQVMENMIASGVILTTNGIPTSIYSAELVSTTRDTLVTA